VFKVEVPGMKLQAYRADLVGVGKGRVEGADLVIIRVQQWDEETMAFSLSLEDAEELMVALAGLLVHEADQPQIIQSK
jgi:hypothetical protein